MARCARGSASVSWPSFAVGSTGRCWSAMWLPEAWMYLSAMGWSTWSFPVGQRAMHIALGAQGGLAGGETHWRAGLAQLLLGNLGILGRLDRAAHTLECGAGWLWAQGNTECWLIAGHLGACFAAD